MIKSQNGCFDVQSGVSLKVTADPYILVQGLGGHTGNYNYV